MSDMPFNPSRHTVEHVERRVYDLNEDVVKQLLEEAIRARLNDQDSKVEITMYSDTCLDALAEVTRVTKVDRLRPM